MIYVHIPFCRSFCTYCGFYSETVPSGKDNEIFSAYADTLIREASARRIEIEATLDTNTLYIGGGTPSVLPLAVLRRIVEALPYGPYDEFTIEVNPEDIIEKGPEYLEGLKAMGVNRVSMGVQSFNDCTLRWMNRRHDSARALQAFRMIREAGITNVSIDLIFGISGVSMAEWRATIAQALALGENCGGKPSHISAYQLSIEEGSALDSMVRKGKYTEAGDEECHRQYDVLCEELSKAGYRHYEISNFALPGFEARHNSAYWSRIPYVGLGAGAHSFDGSFRRWNSELNDHGAYLSESESLSEDDARVETIMLGLRTAAGVDAEWLRRKTEPETLDRLFSEDALIRLSNGRIRIPESRFFVSDEIIRELI